MPVLVASISVSLRNYTGEEWILYCSTRAADESRLFTKPVQAGAPINRLTTMDGSESDKSAWVQQDARDTKGAGSYWRPQGPSSRRYRQSVRFWDGEDHWELRSKR